MTKKQLRAQIRSRLSGLSDEYKRKSSAEIERLLLLSDEYKNARSIFIYTSTPNEPCTDGIIGNALCSGKTVYVPRCLERGVMVPVRIDRDTQYEEGYMGIKEPVEYDKDLSLSQVDLSIIPCMSAAPDGRRLGHGAGFYDIFLSKTKTFRLCLCFNELVSYEIPTDEYDVKMDCVITENGIFYVK